MFKFKCDVKEELILNTGDVVLIEDSSCGYCEMVLITKVDMDFALTVDAFYYAVQLKDGRPIKTNYECNNLKDLLYELRTTSTRIIKMNWPDEVIRFEKA